MGFELSSQFSDEGGTDINWVQDLGFMNARDLSNPDGKLWGAFSWVNPVGAPETAR
ncbi:hypothetical protein [Roseateles sp.]|uniref:hypothetical protein n=1 Tax=Roseateles sp. TaxID=1971397 RepID=UPI003D0A6D7F